MKNMTEWEKSEKYNALARFIAAYDVQNLPTIMFPVEDKDFLLTACLNNVAEKVKENGSILYCPQCERQARKGYDKYCSGCGKKLAYTEGMYMDMKEVTEEEPYNQYGGRCFLCDEDTATIYVANNCPVAANVDELHNISTGKLENKVWWKTTHRKLAHYNADRRLLVIYYTEE